MSLDTYLQLSTHVLLNYLKHQETAAEVTTETPQLVWISIAEPEVKMSLTEIGNSVVVTLVNSESKVTSFALNWDSIELPVEESKAPTELPGDKLAAVAEVLQPQKNETKPETATPQNSQENAQLSFDREQENVERNDGRSSRLKESDDRMFAPQKPPSHPASHPDVHPAPLQQGSSRPNVRPPDMPDFEDEYEVLSRPEGAPNWGIPTIGDRDLNPLSRSNDGGMMPSMNHPIFQGGRSDRLDPNSRLSSNARLGKGVPPGARYDAPYGEEDDSVGMGLPHGSLFPDRNNTFGGSGGYGMGGGFPGPTF